MNDRIKAPKGNLGTKKINPNDYNDRRIVKITSTPVPTPPPKQPKSNK